MAALLAGTLLGTVPYKCKKPCEDMAFTNRRRKPSGKPFQEQFCDIHLKIF